MILHKKLAILQKLKYYHRNVHLNIIRYVLTLYIIDYVCQKRIMYLMLVTLMYALLTTNKTTVKYLCSINSLSIIVFNEELS